jgi:hypothetical protein
MGGAFFVWSKEGANKMKLNPQLVDQVDAIHQKLVNESETYCSFLMATRNDQAVEGSLFEDDVMAARLICDEARKTGSIVVAAAKLAIVRKALRVVLRRYGMDRSSLRVASQGAAPFCSEQTND